MQRDERSMADKILADLETAINKDDYLEEFMIIPVSLSQNKSPVLHVSHNICLESWCVKYLYSYAYQKLLEVRKTVSRKKLLGDEIKYVRRLLLGALLINPDVSTFWNMRRELLTEHYLNIPGELKFSKLLLTYKSKSNEAFSYRKWLIKRILLNEINDKVRIDNLINQEFFLCNLTSEKSQNNYHSWSHRIWILENLLNVCSNYKLVLLHELNYTENFISSHVSEHTGFHYRQYIINKIKNLDISLDKKYYDSINKYFPKINHENTRHVLIDIFGSTEQIWNETNLTLILNSLGILLYDLTLNEELNNLYIDHESIWYHRRYILSNLITLISSYFGVYTNENIKINYENYNTNIVNSNIPYVQEKYATRGEKYPKILNFNIIHSSNLYKVLLKKEKSLIVKYSKNNVRCFDLAKRHEKWLRFVLGINEI